MFDYATLPRDYPSRFVPNATAFEWETMQRLFAELQGRSIGSAEDLKRWLDDESELYRKIDEEGTVRQIRYTTQTDNAEYEKAYLHFVTELEPKIKPLKFELDRKYVSSEFRKALPADFYSVLNRKRENSVVLFRQENVELEKQDAELAQKYQKVAGAMTVNYRGEERTLQQMAKFLEEPDRATREESWNLTEGRRLKDRDALDGIYDEEIKVRDKIAKNAGFANYRDYIFMKKERFDYTPEDCFEYHEAVEQYFVPMSRELDRKRQEQLGVDVLRPWDINVDPQGRPPLHPYDKVDQLVKGCGQVFGAIDPTFDGFFNRMIMLNLLDLESRRGKAPGAYSTQLTDVRLPFIFANAAGRDNDVRTLMHESGHSFHSFLVKDKDYPYAYRTEVPLEIAEVASMAMELMGGEHIEGTFYKGDETKRSNREELISMVKLFCWVATIDSFQHWVYTHPEHNRAERTEAWVKTFKRFSGLESWDGYDENLASRWQRQLHLFEVPFYYIEYGIATIGALGIWVKYRRDRAGAVAAYKNALSLGASRPLPELFGAAGLKWDFGPNAVRGFAEELRGVLFP
jgi:oligoendopeptidase F